MRLVYDWLRDLVEVSETPERLATDISLRGFELASVEDGRLPVIDLEITANRPDCLSHLGLAREVSAIYARQLRDLELSMPAAGSAGPLEVVLEDAELCPRYCAQVFEVAIGPSPSWLAERLDAAGVRPINNIVDITNYVMLELGQPMHAFDLDRVAGRKLVVRRARGGEKLRTLDGVERMLDPEMLVIADAQQASAIGGVMGGADSEINPTTKLIALESAYFQGAAVRRTGKALGLKTEASARFERGADINAAPTAIARAAVLMQKLGAGTPRGSLIDQYPVHATPRTITLRSSRIAHVLGLEVPAHDVRRYLEALGFLVRNVDGPKDPPTQGPTDPSTRAPSAWSVTVPSFRVDVSREVDLIEEVGRHHGFDRIPVTFPVLEQPQPAPDERVERDRRIRTVMTAAGFNESMTFAFIERAAALPFCPGQEPAAIANPLSEKFAVLRPSLLPGLIDSSAHNRRRGRRDVRLFESGSRFTAVGEGRAVAMAWSGDGANAHWSNQVRPVDFFDIKGAVELLGEALGVAPLEFAATAIPYLVPGRSAEVRSGEQCIGVVGLLDAAIAAARGFAAGEDLYVAELDVDAAAAIAGSPPLRAQSLPKFPAIVRDISILVAEALPAAAVRGTIRAAAPATLESLAEFDRYQGKGVPDGRISLSVRLTFRSPERTLTDEEIEAAMDAVVRALHEAHGAERR